jgi:hypothetical protein
MGMVVVLAFSLRVVLSRENAKRRAKEVEGQGLMGGDAHPKEFIYMI